jgi:cell wall-associated NlpC family hydrolase
MRRATVLGSTALVALALVGPARAIRPELPSGPVVSSAATTWADAQVRVVTAAGLFGGDAAGFRPSDPLTRGELADALAAWGKPATVPADPSKLVTISELDAQLVNALGLTPAARRIRLAAGYGQLAPTSRLGTESVARLLGLRLDHPQGQDELELLPTQPATRAEAAYSFARALSLTQGQLTYVDRLTTTFLLPALGDWQRTVLTRALKFVGYPYVWSGTSESTQKLWSASAPGGWVTEPGGFDCSGFVWRVYKLTPYAGEGNLANVLRGRTTFVMSGEVPRSKRITAEKLQPADVMFFGSKGPKSSPDAVDHTALYLGNGWFVQSSGEGVTLLPFAGYYTSYFAWGRRPLREAGLTSS